MHMLIPDVKAYDTIRLITTGIIKVTWPVSSNMRMAVDTVLVIDPYTQLAPIIA